MHSALYNICTTTQLGLLAKLFAHWQIERDKLVQKSTKCEYVDQDSVVYREREREKENGFMIS